jgi:hypothetical protein
MNFRKPWNLSRPGVLYLKIRNLARWHKKVFWISGVIEVCGNNDCFIEQQKYSKNTDCQIY